MMKRKKNKSVKNKLSLNLILIIIGIVSVFLTRLLIEADHQKKIRDIGYRINGYRSEKRQMEFMNAKLSSELEKIKKPDAIKAMLRKYGIKLSMPTLEKMTTISLPNGKRLAKRQ